MPLIDFDETHWFASGGQSDSIPAGCACQTRKKIEFDGFASAPLRAGERIGTRANQPESTHQKQSLSVFDNLECQRILFVDTVARSVRRNAPVLSGPSILIPDTGTQT